MTEQQQLELDAQRWRQLRRNPYAAVDTIIDTCSPNRKAQWGHDADAAIDKLIRRWNSTPK